MYQFHVLFISGQGCISTPKTRNGNYLVNQPSSAVIPKTTVFEYKCKGGRKFLGNFSMELQTAKCVEGHKYEEPCWDHCVESEYKVMHKKNKIASNSSLLGIRREDHIR